MSLNKNKSEIVESFKNLLKKADEVKDLDKSSETVANNRSKDINLVDINLNAESEIQITSERLGIISIKRIPGNPFTKNYKDRNKEKYEKFEYEITQKIDNILKRQLYHWINRELPKYSKSKLRKYIYELLNQLVK